MSEEIKVSPIKAWLPEINNPLLVAGPCSLETEEQALDTARQLAKDPRVFVYRGGVWKPRTRPGSFEGVGLDGLDWLKQVKKETGLRVGTEVANAQHTEAALKAELDVLWIGARSTASPFVVQEIADVLKGTDAVVMVKNPVNPDVQLWMGAIERLSRVGITKLVGIHRGFTPFRETKYRNYPNWQTFIELRRLMPQLPVICDPSHIAGKREYLNEVAQKAFDLGMDGLMMESHRDPSCALSDTAQQLTPGDLFALLDKLIIRREKSTNAQFETQLDLLRNRIDALDGELLATLANRVQIAKEIGKYKRENNVTALQMNRWTEMMNSRVAAGERLDLNRTFVQILFQLIHEDSVRMQTEIMDQN